MKRIPYAVVLALVALIASGDAKGGEFSKSGFDFQWTLDTSFGTNVRTSSVDKALVSFGNGGKAGIGNDSGDLNFDNVFSTNATSLGEIRMRRGKYGAFLRAKAWYDFAKLQDVPHGSYANGYVPNTTLKTSEFDALSKYANGAVLDAYVYGDFSFGEKVLNVRVGKQVVNWGESLFIPGINQFGAFDATAAHRAGTQIKEILLPIPQVFASFGLSKALSVEGFYQFLWSKTILDGCGTYWSPASIINCSNKTGTLVGPALFSDRQLYNGVPALGGANFRMSVRELRPSDQGQYGFALRYRAASIDTDFGFFYANYHPRVPNLSAALIPTTIPGSIWSLNIPGTSRAMQAVLDYSAENTKVTGISAATSVKGWSVLGEVSHSFGVPVQINVTDMLNGVIAGIGPDGRLVATPDGAIVRGYNRKDKTQFQISTIKAFPRKLGAEYLSVIAEGAYQYWSGIGNPATSTRYGRAFVFGSGPVIAPGVCEATPTLNTYPGYCENKGFATKSAGGYRVLAELSYPSVFKGVNIKPRLFLSHDISGYSADALFSQGRILVSPGVRFERSNKYYVDFAYSKYNHNAKYDEFHDRDFFSFVVGRHW